MSIEWLVATNEPAGVMSHGTFVHKYPEPVSYPLAIMFGIEDGAVIEGTATDLLDMLERARKLVLEATDNTHQKL